MRPGGFEVFYLERLVRDASDTEVLHRERRVVMSITAVSWAPAER